MAAQFAAQKLRAIDVRITNRNLICMGPRAGEDPNTVELQRSHRVSAFVHHQPTGTATSVD